MRKQLTDIKTRYDGKLFYSSTIFPIIKENERDIIYITKLGDRLDYISYKFYKNPSSWWIIAMVNNLPGKISVNEGIQLKIPHDISNIITQINDNN